MTPTWSGILGYLFLGIEDGNAQAKAIAKEEFQNMAKAADEYNILIKKFNADTLSQVIREVDGNNDLGAGLLAEKIIEKLLDRK